ncbi:MAG TPA: mannose-1-phosphate guanylyltransferase [Candidatus Sulfotelmatobacter sp.]|nr:mannose-1-phosphate guanylyltransferase [Candidatus Sulfotelmatobacter sp.]
MADRFILILAGGRGERFWPWSTPQRPKQLLPLASGGRTLLGATLERALALAPADRIVVLTARDLEAAVERECPAGVRVIGEPAGRNTAPAIGAAAVWFSSVAPGASFAVMPSDHAIERVADFRADLERAFTFAEKEAALLTFGVPPTGPDTNFGYIKRGTRAGERLFRVAAFTEKPDRATAEGYLATGLYSWNSGIFVWRASVFLDALEASRPALATPLRELARDTRGPGFDAKWDAAFPKLEAISVDYAVLEKAPNTFMLETSFDWDDLGSWGAWARRQPRDADGNVLHGDAVAVNCRRCVVVGEGGTAAAMGLEEMVVVHVNGSTLSCRLDQTEQVRKVNEAVRARAAK